MLGIQKPILQFGLTLNDPNAFNDDDNNQPNGFRNLGNRLRNNRFLRPRIERIPLDSNIQHDSFSKGNKPSVDEVEHFMEQLSLTNEDLTNNQADNDTLKVPELVAWKNATTPDKTNEPPPWTEAEIASWTKLSPGKLSFTEITSPSANMNRVNFQPLERKQ